MKTMIRQHIYVKEVKSWIFEEAVPWFSRQNFSRQNFSRQNFSRQIFSRQKLGWYSKPNYWFDPILIGSETGCSPSI
jgi:hypothetical protein